MFGRKPGTPITTLLESSEEDDGVARLDPERVQAQVGDLVLAQEQLRKLKLPEDTRSALRTKYGIKVDWGVLGRGFRSVRGDLFFRERFLRTEYSSNGAVE